MEPCRPVITRMGSFLVDPLMGLCVVPLGGEPARIVISDYLNQSYLCQIASDRRIHKFSAQPIFGTGDFATDKHSPRKAAIRLLIVVSMLP